jgi:hypothetical protein
MVSRLAASNLTIDAFSSASSADSDEAGHGFRKEAGHRFRSEAGRDSDLMPATQRSLPRIGAMMLRGDGSVKRAPILGLRRPRRMVGL